MAMMPPTASDPLGQRPDPTSLFEAIEMVVDRRIERRLIGRAAPVFNGVTDLELVHELLARGWAVFRPSLKGTES